MKMGMMDWIAWVLVIVGGLNWGLIGFFEFDLVAMLLGDMTMAARIVYDLVGLSAVYLVVMMGGKMGQSK